MSDTAVLVYKAIGKNAGLYKRLSFGQSNLEEDPAFKEDVSSYNATFALAKKAIAIIAHLNVLHTKTGQALKDAVVPMLEKRPVLPQALLDALEAAAATRVQKKAKTGH